MRREVFFAPSVVKIPKTGLTIVAGKLGYILTLGLDAERAGFEIARPAVPNPAGVLVGLTFRDHAMALAAPMIFPGFPSVRLKGAGRVAVTHILGLSLELSEN